MYFGTIAWIAFIWVFLAVTWRWFSVLLGLTWSMAIVDIFGVMPAHFKLVGGVAASHEAMISIHVAAFSSVLVGPLIICLTLNIKRHLKKKQKTKPVGSSKAATRAG